MNLSLNCQEFEARLERCLDERLDPLAPELQAHADRCPACGECLQQAVLLLRGVAAWRRQIPIPSADLTDRIVATLGRSPDRLPAFQSRNAEACSLRPESVSGQWQAWLVGLAGLAAMWLLFVGSTGHDAGNPDRRLTAVGPSNSTDANRPTVDQTPQADLEAVLVSAEGAYSQLATETLEVAQDFALLWPTSQAMSDSTAPSVAPENSVPNWKPGWPRELTPIGDSVGDALDFLWRAAPRVEKSAS